MKKKTFYTSLAFALILSFALAAFAQMGSENYSIPTSVVSGGGGAMSSEGYQTDATVGQPSPLMDPAYPPSSTNYALYPGFWYTLAAVAGDPPVIEDITFDECISELCNSLISVSAYDPEGGDLTYTWEALDGGAIIGTGADVDFDPPGPSVYPDCDPYGVKVTVTSDSTGLSTSETIGIYVKLAGDANGDGVVNTKDKKLVRNSFGQSGTPGWVDADVNCDGFVNTKDKKLVRNQFGQTGCTCP